jgi:putative membrane protein insertion efficiency factor
LLLGVGAAVLATDLPRQTELAALRLYQRVGSPVMRHVVTCRFRPTCSQYALEVLERDGFWKGNAEVGVRLARCSPLGMLF